MNDRLLEAATLFMTQLEVVQGELSALMAEKRTAMTQIQGHDLARISADESVLITRLQKLPANGIDIGVRARAKFAIAVVAAFGQSHRARNTRRADRTDRTGATNSRAVAARKLGALGFTSDRSFNLLHRTDRLDRSLRTTLTNVPRRR